MNRNNRNQIHEGATIAGLVHDFIVTTGSTEAELSELLAVDQAQVSRWRRGNTVPRHANMASLADVLGVDYAELEACRVASERVRAELAERKRKSPEADLEKVLAELKTTRAKVKRLERELRQK